MKVENNIDAGHLTNAREILARFVSLPAVDPEGAVIMGSIDMYAENLDDYGESLNDNAVSMTKDRGRIKE